MVYVDRSPRRVDEHWSVGRLSYDGVFPRGPGQAGGARWVGRKRGIIPPILLNEFELTLDITLITKEKETATYSGACRRS
jgi:hypothetical protein